MSMRILVVDDNYDFRTTLIEFLAGKGYEVKGASNGKHALQLMGYLKFDLMLLDLDMPIMDGIDTVNEIWRLQSDIHIIIITGLKNVKKYFFYEKGCLSFEHKPLDLVELEYKIKNIFSTLEARKRERIPDDTIVAKDINTVYEFILENIDDYDLNVDFMADSLFVNKKQLYDRIGDVLTISVHDIIKNLRLLRARELVEKGLVRSTKEVSNRVGYKDSGYFSKIYRKAFDEDLTKKIKLQSNSILVENQKF